MSDAASSPDTKPPEESPNAAAEKAVDKGSRKEDTDTVMTDSQRHRHRPITYCITGMAAHQRWKPLLPPDWIDASPYGENHQSSSTPDWLWENAPRRVTATWRDHVSCYSHLPHGSALLDSKWVLSRLLGTDSDHDESSKVPLATLETHCFQGRQGWIPLAQQLGLLTGDTTNNEDEDASYISHQNNATSRVVEDKDPATAEWSLADFADLASRPYQPPPKLSSSSKRLAPNWWVIKDAASNGAGGIWMVGPHNAVRYGQADTSPLIEEHLYVAQRYVWPGVLYQGRKAHVRVYAVWTADGKAHVHQRAFLHVANEPFGLQANTTTAFEDAVHLTNCCANSHDAHKFAGEICARLWGDATTPTAAAPVEEIDLSLFAPSIFASVAALAERTAVFLQGGQANGGLEYLGLDFILSHRGDNQQPVAYLLEVNAPPSQDTATGLPHAEAVHDTVLRDMFYLWILPRVCPEVAPVAGGWRCVYTPDEDDNEKDVTSSVVPSQAALKNRLRWALYEHKIRRQISRSSTAASAMSHLATRVRPHFAFYRRDDSRIFWENGGGTQVPQFVVQKVQAALEHRHRHRTDVVWKQQARHAMGQLLGVSSANYQIGFGANATQLLAQLARILGEALSHDDEIVLSTENHWAHVQPWLSVAQKTSANIVWWKPGGEDEEGSLSKALSDKTRIVALTHVSNVLGVVRNLSQQVAWIRRLAPRAVVVADGVAAVPHLYANVEASDIDWYVVSCHKCFGPHLGVISGKTSLIQTFSDRPVATQVSSIANIEHLFESGTVNYEACAGVQGIVQYFVALGRAGGGFGTEGPVDESKMIQAAYVVIAKVERLLTKALLDFLRKCPMVHLLSDEVTVSIEEQRLPVVSFVHESIGSATLVNLFSKEGIDCRHSTFLSSPKFLQGQPQRFAEGFVRLSMVHYNTVAEVQKFMQCCEQCIPNWFGSDAAVIQV